MDGLKCERNCNKIDFINSESKSFLSDLEREYKECIVKPYRKTFDVLLMLKCKFGLQQRTLIENLDNITYATLKDLSIENIHLSDIYIVEDNEVSHIFYLYFHSRFALEPWICIVYDRDTDRLRSNCSMLEMYITILQGIGIDEIKNDSVKYHNYLNTLYLFDMCKREIEIY